MPCGPTSAAAERTIPTNAILLAAYAVRFINGRFPVIEPMTTILPNLRSTISGSTSWQHKKVPVTFTANVSAQSDGLISQIGAVGPAIPLLATRTSITPNSSRACAIPRRTEFSSLRSSATTAAWRFFRRTSLAVSCRESIERPATMTWAPSVAHLIATALPIPRPPPVTKTTLSSKRSALDIRHHRLQQYSVASCLYLPLGWSVTSHTGLRLLRGPISPCPTRL